MKTIVLTVSRNFPKHHPKAGEQTKFVEHILTRTKRTTIRGNYDRWADIEKKLNAGTHVLSVRFWRDKPYKSKQVTFLTVTKIKVSSCFISNMNSFKMSINDIYQPQEKLLEISKNEGFSAVEDFTNWFQDETFNGAMIEFLEGEPLLLYHLYLINPNIN